MVALRRLSRSVYPWQRCHCGCSSRDSARPLLLRLPSPPPWTRAPNRHPLRPTNTSWYGRVCSGKPRPKNTRTWRLSGLVVQSRSCASTLGDRLEALLIMCYIFRTESYDDMGPVIEDPRWEAFRPFHEYLSGAFPLLYVP